MAVQGWISGSDGALADARGDDPVGSTLPQDHRHITAKGWKNMVFVPVMAASFAFDIDTIDPDMLTGTEYMPAGLVCRSHIRSRIAGVSA